ncbi:MAG: DHH family phosphoesterase [Euryarchaeota archaeon]|nr:DHH family phosphoesterase [Euryarchaeota archaeon]
MDQVGKALEGLEAERVMVVFHNDCDGICSGAQLVGYIRRRNEVGFLSTRGSAAITPELMDDIKEWGPDVVVTVDFAKDLDLSARELAEHGVRCIMLDHHPVPDYDFPESTLYFNPLLEGRPMPASALVYDALGEPGNLWMAAVGTILDYGTLERPDLVEKAIELYPELFETKELDTPKLFRTSFGRIGHILNASFLWGGHRGGELALRGLLEAGGPREFLMGKTEAARTLLENFQAVDDDLRRLVGDFRRRHRAEGRLVWYRVESRYPQKSQVATVVSGEYPDRVVVIIQEMEGRARFSLRNQSGEFDLNRLVRTAAEGLDAHGGGHKKAAAASTSLEDAGELDRLKVLVNQNI